MATAGTEQNEIGALVGPFGSAARVCRSMRVSVDALTSRQGAGEVLGLLTSDGVTVYPAWQFTQREGLVEVHPVLAEVFRTLRTFDPWAVAVLLLTPAPELDGMAPLGWLDRGRNSEDVVEVGLQVAREWSAG